MLQDKQAEEEGEDKSNIGAVRWGIEGSPAAAGGADTEYKDGEGAEAAWSGARSRGAVLAHLNRSQNTGGTAGRPYNRCSAGRCLRRCRRLRRASARHTCIGLHDNTKLR